MSDRDRSDWVQFASGVLSGMHTRAGVAAVSQTDAVECARLVADHMLAETKQRWPDPAKTCSPRCDSVTPPPAGDETVTCVGEAPVMYAVQWDGDDTPDPECCKDTVVVCNRVLEDAGRKGKVVPLYAANQTSDGRGDQVQRVVEAMTEILNNTAREIAAARREAEDARAECERLRMTEEERLLLSTYRRSAERAVKQYGTTSAEYIAKAKQAAEVIGGLLDRHAPPPRDR